MVLLWMILQRQINKSRAGVSGKNSGAVGAFVMDTVSGETRTVYMRTYGKPPASRAVKNDLKKPFHAID